MMDIDIAAKAGGIETRKRQYARETVFRCYRVKFPCRIPGWESPEGKSVPDLLHMTLQDSQVQQIADYAPDGSVVLRDAAGPGLRNVDGRGRGQRGKHLHQGRADHRRSVAGDLPKGQPQQEPGDEQIYPRRIQHRRGIRHRAVQRANVFGGAFPTAASVVSLRPSCGCERPARSAMTRWGRFRWYRNRSTGSGLGTPMRYVRHDEIVAKFYAVYDSNFGVKKVLDNTAQVNQDCDYYIDALRQEYQQTRPQTIRYAGLKDLELDGAIQHIVFEVGSGSGATTLASRNCERHDWVRAPTPNAAASSGWRGCAKTMHW